MNQPIAKKVAPPQASTKDFPPRRGFIVKLTTVVLSALAGIIPAASGLVVFFDPLRRKTAAAAPLKICSFDAIPSDGTPRRFPVIYPTLDDAWTRYRNVPAGSVYIERNAAGELRAFNATCPHLGCLIGYEADKNCFLCPCHGSEFQLDGERVDPASSPSPRNMDPLPCEVRDGEVWVTFQNFETGIEERRPIT